MSSTAVPDIVGQARNDMNSYFFRNDRMRCPQRGPCPSLSVGFARAYQSLRHDAMLRLPPGTVSFHGEPTKKKTGWFEVTVDGKLVFSSKAGMGRFNSESKKQHVLSAIDQALVERGQGI